MNKGVATGENGRQFDGIADIVDAERPVADRSATSRPDKQELVGVTQPFDGGDQHIELLFPGGAAGKNQKPILGREAQPPPQPVSIPALGMEDGRIHAERQPDRVADACLDQPSGDETAGGHGLIELPIDRRPALLYGLLSPIADMQRGELSKVGMTEPDHRHTQRVASAQRRETWRVGIPRLDEVGLLADQTLHPCLFHDRPAVARSKRQRRSVDGHLPASVMEIARAGDDQRMANIGTV